MKEFKKKLISRQKLLIVICILMAATCLFSIAAECGLLKFLPEISTEEYFIHRMRGFLCGFSLSVFVVMLIRILRNRKALKNEELLKKQFITESDERTKQIMVETRSTTMLIIAYLLCIAIVISGYINYTVHCTLIYVMFGIGLITAICRMIYSKKY